MFHVSILSCIFRARRKQKVKQKNPWPKTTIKTKMVTNHPPAPHQPVSSPSFFLVSVLMSQFLAFFLVFFTSSRRIILKINFIHREKICDLCCSLTYHTKNSCISSKWSGTYTGFLLYSKTSKIQYSLNEIFLIFLSTKMAHRKLSGDLCFLVSGAEKKETYFRGSIYRQMYIKIWIFSSKSHSKSFGLSFPHVKLASTVSAKIKPEKSPTIGL